MVFERKYKGASEFLRASKRGPVRSASDDFPSENRQETGAGFDGAVMGLISRRACDTAAVADALNAPVQAVELAIRRLVEQGFVEPPADGTPCKLTDAGQRYLKYSQLTKF